jgi:hypothetical protein
MVGIVAATPFIASVKATFCAIKSSATVEIDVVFAAMSAACCASKSVICVARLFAKVLGGTADSGVASTLVGM